MWTPQGACTVSRIGTCGWWWVVFAEAGLWKFPGARAGACRTCGLERTHPSGYTSTHVVTLLWEETENYACGWFTSATWHRVLTVAGRCVARVLATWLHVRVGRQHSPHW